MRSTLAHRSRIVSTLVAAAAVATAVVAAPVPAHASTCHWVVVWSTAGVYPEPDRRYTSLKTKHSGDRVGPYCTTYWNSYWGEYYVAVACDCDRSDRVGWMRYNALRYDGA